MIITINRIDVAHVPELQQGLGSYWIEFESPFACGKALLYSRTTRNALLSGRQIGTEIGQHDIEDFCLLSGPSHSYQGRLVPLSTRCDYEVTGRVASLYDEIFLVDVEAGRCSFAIAFDKINPITVNEGDWVTFKVNRLELWDEHL